MTELDNWKISDIDSVTVKDEDNIEHTIPWKSVYVYGNNIYFTKKECDEAIKHWDKAIKSDNEATFDNVNSPECQKEIAEIIEKLEEIDDSNCKPSGEEKMSYCINKYINKSRHNKRRRRQYGRK